MMKKLLFILMLFSIVANAQIGIGTSSPQPSAALDVTSTNKGFLPPRMTQVQMNAIAAPAEGLIVFCIDCVPDGLRLFNNGIWNELGSSTPTPLVVNNCDINGFTGAYASGFAFTASNKFSVTVTNNSFFTASVAFSNADVALSGVAGLTVTGTSPATATLIAGASQLVEYTLSGTPASTGTLTATWNKLTLNCTKTKTIGALSSLVGASYCTSSLLNGQYLNGFALGAANTFTVAITNTSGATVNGFPIPSVGNLILSGAGSSGLTVTSVSPSATYNLTNGETKTFTYTLSGTPTNVGALTASWSYGDLTCSKTTTVGGLSSVVGASYCASSLLNGQYVNGVAFTAANTFAVTITNTSGATINGFAAPSVGNLSLSGSASSGLTVTSVSPTGVYNLANGATRTFTYALSGTPSSIGTLTASWSYGDLTCVKSNGITNGDALLNLPAGAAVVSICQGASCSQINLQGVVDNTTNKKIVNVSYTGGLGSYDAYTSGWIVNNSSTGEAADTNSFRISYPASTFSASGSIPVTIEVDGDGSFNALKLAPGSTQLVATMPLNVNGNFKGNITLTIVTCGAPTSSGGFLVFKCHNLGADESADPFTPSWQLNGAYIQWGKRGPTGNWQSAPNNGALGFAAAPTGSTAGTANDAAVASWSTTDAANGAWNVTEASPLKTVNDPCPSGYRVPTRNEWLSIYSTTPINTTTNWSNVGTWTNSPTNYSSGKMVNNSLYLPACGYRTNSSGTLASRGSSGYYWNSKEASTNASFINFSSSSVVNITYDTYRAYGYSVRCVLE